MNTPTPTVEIALRIPGKWSHPRELLQRMPEDCRLTPEKLTLADGTEVDFGAVAADDQFAAIFRQSCRGVPTPEEQATVDGYEVNVLLRGAGGSKASAQTMMQAAAAIVRAGGAGVFIDNSALAHGGEDWLAMTGDGSSDAISFAFVSIIRGKSEVYTMGMHALGLREVFMKRADVEKGFDIVDVIRYLARGDDPVENGHIIADQNGPRFQAFAEEAKSEFSGSVMHNPFGRLRLVSMRDITEAN